MSLFPEQIEITLGLDSSEEETELRRAVAKQLGMRLQDVPALYVKKRALDARRGRVQFHLLLAPGSPPKVGEIGLPHPRECTAESRVVVVGDGPAGLFCAYQLAREGIACTVVDRGKEVQPRRRDLKLLNARGGVDADSNYCFGEGGAGTYSDGKLYTRSHKRGPVRDVMEILALHGAPEAVLTEARPHIGSNLLPEIISALRERLQACGVTFLFGTRLIDLLVKGEGTERRVTGVQLEAVQTGEKSELAADSVVMATGHSARDIFTLLETRGVRLEAKGFALGVRIEHPQQLINKIQYGAYAGHEKLGAASYKLAAQVEGRGVFSFCMCPGGWIVPAMTDAEHLVVNGMSLSKRDSAFANSGMVVGVEVSDMQAIGLSDALAGMRIQKRAERAAAQAGGGENRAPAVRLTDFLRGRASSTLPETSYLPGLSAASLDEVLDATGLPLAAKLREAFSDFERRMRGYITGESVLVGVESRTSAPVRVPRDPETDQSPDLAGLYPCGEGAGYAGGIVSAAVDGLRVAQSIARTMAGRATS